MGIRLVILLIIAVELFSLTGHFFPILNATGFIIIIGATLIASIIKLECGLYVALTELIIGGMGYLFAFPIGATALSVRIGIFLVVMAVWLAKVFQTMSFRPSEASGGISHRSFIERVRSLGFARDDRGRGILKWWGLFGMAIIWGIFMGFLRKNDFGNVFLDANGYLYAVMILPFVWMINREKLNNGGGERLLKHFSTIFIISTTWLAIKTLFAVYLYTHASHNFIAANIASFYQWVRDAGVGEITWLPGNLARVFFQSHIYNLIAFFVLFIAILTGQKGSFATLRMTKGRVFILCALNLAVVVIGLSRSFWLGTLAGMALIFYFSWRRHISWQMLKIALGVAIGAILILILVARLPIPFSRSSSLNLSEATKSRLEFEVAASSRWNLLPPLWQAVEKHWLLGSGFGTTVTYISNDPRVRSESPTGLYTTYAFEWGWLDLWLKLGLVGLILYITLLWQITRRLWQNSKANYIALAGFVLLFVLAVVNFFTPYLNHPLGFGILILTTIVIASKENNE